MSRQGLITVSLNDLTVSYKDDKRPAALRELGELGTNYLLFDLKKIGLLRYSPGGTKLELVIQPRFGYLSQKYERQE